ncbi:MAG: PAS domain S-box protein, partial [bacterium]
MATQHDIAQQVRAEEASGISEEGFRTLFNNLPIACFGYDRKGRVQVWNRAYEELYGFRAKEIVTHSIL